MSITDLLAKRNAIQTGIASTTSDNPTDPNFDPSEVTADQSNELEESNEPVAAVAEEQPVVAAEVDWNQPVRFKKVHIRRIQDHGWVYPEDGYFYPKSERQFQTLRLLSKEGHVVAENYSL